jgi:hypothetical protein
MIQRRRSQPHQDLPRSRDRRSEIDDLQNIDVSMVIKAYGFQR